MNEIESLKTQLKEEIKRREQIENQAAIMLHERDQQLLSALAAIEQAIDILAMQDNAGKGRTLQEVSGRNQQAIDQLRNVDLSLLHEHDVKIRDEADKYWRERVEELITEHKQELAEVRKPLVELLRSVHTWFMQQAPQHYNGCGLWIYVDDELAKYPRQNCILDVDSPSLPPQREEYLQCGCVNCRDALAKVKQ